jgi:hypothetical protein
MITITGRFDKCPTLLGHLFCGEHYARFVQCGVPHQTRTHILIECPPARALLPPSACPYPMLSLRLPHQRLCLLLEPPLQTMDSSLDDFLYDNLLNSIYLPYHTIILPHFSHFELSPPRRLRSLQAPFVYRYMIKGSRAAFKLRHGKHRQVTFLRRHLQLSLSILLQ